MNVLRQMRIERRFILRHSSFILCLAMLRIVHGPMNFGNQAWVLSRQERALGVDSRVVVNVAPPNGYSADRVLSSNRRSPLGLLRRLAFGLSAPWQFDVLHYYYGRSYIAFDGLDALGGLRFADLKFARRLERKVFMTLQGCDVRLAGRGDSRYEITACRTGHCSQFANCRDVVDQRRRHLIEHVLPLCNRVFVLNPEFCQYVPGATFLPYASIDVQAVRPVPPRLDGPIRIVHAPTDPSIKGTALVQAAIERLKTKYPIEFTLVQGLSHADAWQIYRSADLVIDQLLLGWYGGLALEAMALGKPVVSYVRESDLGYLPAAMRDELPVQNVTPQTLVDRLEEIFDHRPQWGLWSQRARQYALRWHDPRKIAEQMVAAYRDPESRFELQPADLGALPCAA